MESGEATEVANQLQADTSQAQPSPSCPERGLFLSLQSAQSFQLHPVCCVRVPCYLPTTHARHTHHIHVHAHAHAPSLRSSSGHERAVTTGRRNGRPETDAEP